METAYGNGFPQSARSAGAHVRELSVVIPCYDEAEVLRELHRRLDGTLRPLGIDCEIILVNDGSRDDTWSIMMELAATDSRLVLVNLSRNHGHQLALSAGLSLAVGRRILIIDADLQDPPELLPEMIRLMDSGADVVYGVRRQRDGETGLKLLTATLFYRVIERLTDIPIPRDAGDFRLVSRRALDILVTMPERHRFIRGMVAWIGFRQEPIFYDRHARQAGQTKYSLWKMIRFATDAITAFSTRPLAIASWLGISTGLLSCVLIISAAVAWVQGSAVVGWTSLMATVALFGSIQLTMLGIIGEYLGRMYEQGKGRPLFIIEGIVRSAPDADTMPKPLLSERTAATSRVCGVPLGMPDCRPSTPH